MWKIFEIWATSLWFWPLQLSYLVVTFWQKKTLTCICSCDIVSGRVSLALWHIISVITYPSHLQLAMIPIFGWWEVGMSWRVEWRCASGDSGEQCVMTPGILQMQVLYADSSVWLRIVRGLPNILTKKITTTLRPVQTLNLISQTLAKSIHLSDLYFITCYSYILILPNQLVFQHVQSCISQPSWDKPEQAPPT